MPENHIQVVPMSVVQNGLVSGFQQYFPNRFLLENCLSLHVIHWFTVVAGAYWFFYIVSLPVFPIINGVKLMVFWDAFCIILLNSPVPIGVVGISYSLSKSCMVRVIAIVVYAINIAFLRVMGCHERFLSYTKKGLHRNFSMMLLVAIKHLRLKWNQWAKVPSFWISASMKNCSLHFILCCNLI